MQCGHKCDSHTCLTENGDVVFIVHIFPDDGCIKVQMVLQHRWATTFFRGNGQIHGAMNARTWAQLVGCFINNVEKGRDEMYAVMKWHVRVSSDDHIWFLSYGRAAMSDLAWELRCYQDAMANIDTWTMKHGAGSGQLWENKERRKKRSDTQLRIAKKNYGDGSPFANLYKSS